MEPTSNAGKDFLAGYLSCYDRYWGQVDLVRLDPDDLQDAQDKAAEYEKEVLLDPDRQ
jgi:hypothetical protein